MAKPFSCIPGPRAFPVIGSLWEYSRLGSYRFDRLHLAKIANHKKYGLIYKEQLGPAANIIQLYNPSDIQTVLRADGRYPVRPALPITIAANKRDGITLGMGSLNGEEWYLLRSSVQKLMMHPRAANVYLPAQNEVSNQLLDVIHNDRDSRGEVPDLYNLLMKYTMESIAVVCFNARLGILTDRSNQTSTVGQRMMAASRNLFDATQNTNFAFPWFDLFRSPRYKQFLDAKLICNSIAQQFINNALQNLPNAATNSVESEEFSPGNFLHTLLKQTSLEPKHIIGLTTELFTAGIDSTANALSFLLYNLSKNAASQERLVAEIKQTIADGESVSADMFEKLPFMRACVKESLRLHHPTEGGTFRVLQKDLILSGYQCPTGSVASFNNQTICLSEQYFEDAHLYKPERWLKCDQQRNKPPNKPPPFVIMPFGHGARMCIGRRFAEQEIYLAIIKIMQLFRLEYHYQDIGMLNRVFTAPDIELRIAFIPHST